MLCSFLERSDLSFIAVIEGEGDTTEGVSEFTGIWGG